jgi:hypothetical protein
MSDEVNMEAIRVAHAAESTAKDAMHLIDSHEKVCSERYAGINKQLEQLPSIARSIGELKGALNKAVGAVMALSVLSVLLAILKWAGI